MKGNKFLAAVLAASMAFSMVPATTIGVMAAIPAATSSNTADADGTVTSGNPTEADFGTVLGTISGDATATPVSVSTTAETLKKYLVTVAQTGSTSLKDATFDITELNAEAPSYDATTGTFTKGYLTGTIEAEGKDSTTSNSYDFRLTANTLDAADIANLAAQAAKAEIEKTDNATYTATGTVSKIAVLKKAEAAAAKVNAGVTVDVTMGDQPESTKDAQGSVTGTITTSYVYTDSDGKKTTYTSDAAFSATRAKSTILIDTLSSTIFTDVTGHTFPDDVTADQIKNFIENKLYTNGSAIATSATSGYSTLGSNGITAEVGLGSSVKVTHDNTTDSTMKATITLKEGTSMEAKTINLTLRQSNDEIFDEVAANIATAVEAKNKELAKNAGKSGYSSINAATDVASVLSTAWTAKVDGSTKALSADSAYLDDITSTNSTNLKIDTSAAPTITSDGKVVVTYTATINETDSTDGTADAGTKPSKKITFTLNYPKLTTSAATSIELGNAKTLYLLKAGQTVGTDQKVDTDGDGTADITGSTTALSENGTYTYDSSSKTYTKAIWNKLGLIVSPATANDITFSSSNSSVATADLTNGITAYKAGTTTITATSSKGITDSVKVTVVDSTVPFDDVTDANAYYFNAIQWGKDKNVVEGINDTTFGVGQDVTRAQFITFLYRLSGSPYADTTSKFTDVASDKYYAKAVAWAADKGIAQGTSDTTFSPDAVITRAQAATFMYRLSGEESATTRKYFDDVNKSAYYFDAVNWAYTNGITSGTTDTTFSPEETCTREQAVTFIYRYAN